MLVKECMRKDLVTVLPSASLKEVARKFAEQKVGSVLVTDQKGNLKGILTDRDICLAVVAEGKDSNKTLAQEIMTQAPLSTEYDADLDAALRIMNEAHARRLPVTDKGKLVGIISSADLAGAFKNQFDQFFGLEETYVRH